MRRKLSLAEEWLYLWTENGGDLGNNQWHAFDPSSSKWFKLSAMPHDDRIAGYSSYASLDGNFSVIGGSLLSTYEECGPIIPSKTVSYFDTSSHCWGRIADLNVARIKCKPGVINNKLYVFGGYLEDLEEAVTAEVYDPITDTWIFISSMRCPLRFYDSAVMDGKFYVKNDGCRPQGLVYDADKDVWDDMAYGMHTGWRCRSAVLGGKLYTLRDRFSRVIKNKIHVYNVGENVWEAVEGFWDVCTLPHRLGEI